jgi:hypothetical protein
MNIAPFNCIPIMITAQTCVCNNYSSGFLLDFRCAAFLIMGMAYEQFLHLPGFINHEPLTESQRAAYVK